jgi:hypothetical protein
MALQMNAGETFDLAQTREVKADDVREERRILDEPINRIVRRGRVGASSLIPVRAVDRQVLVHQPSIASRGATTAPIATGFTKAESPHRPGCGRPGLLLRVGDPPERQSVAEFSAGDKAALTFMRDETIEIVPNRQR